MKFKFICVIVVAILALCSTSCVENAQAFPTTTSSDYSITRVYWDPISELKIYKVKTPNYTVTVLRDDGKGGLCVLD